VPKPDFNKKLFLRVLAIVVLVFTGIQIYQIFIETSTLIDWFSILISAGMVLILWMISNNQSHHEKQPESLSNNLVENENSAVLESHDQNVADRKINEKTEVRNTDAEEFFIVIREDLQQVDRLVSDAVNNLVANFGYISKLSKNHHEMVLAIEKMAAPEGSKQILSLLEKQMVIADKIEHELDTAVTSLQFGDLVTQLIAHTAKQVETLNMVLQRIDRQADWKGHEKSIEEIHADLSKAINVVNAKNKRKPVVQQGMQMGDVELF